MIFWGYFVAAAAIFNCVLLYTLTDTYLSFGVWLLMVPAGAVSYFIERRVNRKTLVKTHIDKISAIVWMGYVISIIVFLTVIHIISFKYANYHFFLLTTPVILTMIGMGQFVTACIFRKKMWYAFSALTWIGAVVCAFLELDIQFIVLAACMILGFAVPGHIMNHQAKKSHV